MKSQNKSRDKLTDFELKVLKKLARVPVGRVVTYGELAKAVSCPGASQAVGNAVRKNPWAPEVPCHRVVKSNGQVGGYARGTRKKIEVLKKEGIDIKREKITDCEKFLFKF